MFDKVSPEKYSQNWQDFPAYLKSVFCNLRDDTSFSDVTLVSEDGQQFETHKVILLTSSRHRSLAMVGYATELL